MAERPADAKDPLVGTTLSGRYEILRPIGEGGMGIVYEARHVVIEKRVALKVLRDDYSSRPEVVERFRQEARSASRIGDEHIVDISDFGETPRGRSFFVMEYLEGEDLASVLHRDGTLTPTRAVDIAMQCAQALGAAHDKGIVHRDIKPENIFLVSRGEREDFVKIVDFGIAKITDARNEAGPGKKLTKTGMIFGTPEYMSPEQAAGKPLDHRVDVYAMGIILFEVLAGQVPFKGETFMGILTKHMFEPVPPLRSFRPDVQCPAELESVIRKALSKEPDDRFQNMKQLGRALGRAMDLSGPFSAVSSSPPAAPVTARPGPRLLEADEVSALDSRPPHAGGLGRLGLWLAVGLVALGVGLFTYLGLSPESGERAPGAAPENGSGSSADPRGAPGRNGISRLGVSAAKKKDPSNVASVWVRVSTAPSKAAVSVEGRGDVCGPSPCVFETKRGEPIRILAKRGRLHASHDVIPGADTELELTLTGPAPRPRPPKKEPGGIVPRTDDLKIPDELKMVPDS